VLLVEQELLTLPEILTGTISSGISDQLRDIYSICRCCWNVATYKWKVLNVKIEIISFVVVSCFSTDNRHTYGYKLCSCFRRLVPLFGQSRLHTGASPGAAGMLLHINGKFSM
jgi:hypothetical protein